MTEALEFLKSHRFFRNLPQAQVDSLFSYCRVLEYPAGATVFYRNERVDALVLVMSGCLLLGEERAFGGNSLFLSHLALPEKINHSLEVREDSRIIILSREAFLSWLDRFPKAARGLGSQRSRRVNGGFPSAFWREYGVLLPQKRKRSGGQKPLLNLREWGPIWFFRQWWLWIGVAVTAVLPLSPLFLLLWIPPLVAVLSIRFANGLSVTSRAVIGRIFRVKGLHRHSMKIPLEQIQAVEIHRKGLHRALFRIGSLAMKTSSHEGTIVVRNLRKAERAETLLNRLRVKEVEGRDLMTALKEARERRSGNPLKPRLLFQGDQAFAKEDSPGNYRFKKSGYALLKRGFLPLLFLLVFLFLWLFPLLPANLSFLSALLALFPGGIFLYRWQDWRNDQFKVVGNQVFDVDRKPLGKEMTRRQIPLEGIENVTAIQKGLFPLIFNSGDVQVMIPGNTSDFVFEDVSDPWYVQDQLLRLRWMEQERIKKQQARVREEELLTLADLLSQELSENSRS